MAAGISVALLSLLIFGCAPARIATPPPPPRVECGPLETTRCEAAVPAILDTVADPPSAPIVVRIEDGSYCVGYLSDGVACPARPMPPGADWIGRAEVVFGNRYESGLVNLSVGPAGAEANLVSIERRPQAPPTEGS